MRRLPLWLGSPSDRHSTFGLFAGELGVGCLFDLKSAPVNAGGEGVTSDGKLPHEITVWACPVCGYWREDKSSGVHQTANPDDPTGRMVRHDLDAVTYVLGGLGEGELFTHRGRA